ncbi:MAG: Yip1 family protein [Ignavibacteriales bacterium]
MKNVITCKNCNNENPYFSFICKSCSSYLRERVVNIDLWYTIGQLVESPTKAFSQIIHAEHKNFIFFLSFLMGIKFFVNSLILSEPVFKGGNIFSNISPVFGMSVIGFFLVIVLFSYAFTAFTKILKVKTRFKDNLSVFIYSQTPIIFSLVFLLPVELVLFGGFLFSANPSPFLLKPTPALVLSIMELIMFLWAVILGFAATYTATRSKVYSIIVTLTLNLLLMGFMLLTCGLFS